MATTPTQSKVLRQLEEAERFRMARSAQREAAQTWTATGKLRPRASPVHKPLRSGNNSHVTLSELTNVNTKPSVEFASCKKPLPSLSSVGSWPTWQAAGERAPVRVSRKMPVRPLLATGA